MINTNLQIILHETENDYLAHAEMGTGNAEYQFNEGGGVIHINLPKVKPTTIAHEIFHAIFLDKIGDKDVQRKAEEMIKSVRKTLKPSSNLAKEIDDFVKLEEGLSVI